MQLQKRTAIGLTIIYSLFGVAWILVSDWFFYTLYDGLEDFVYFSVIKGLLFVMVSTFMLYGALSVFLNRHKEKMTELNTILENQDTYAAYYQNQKRLMVKMVEHSPVPQILHREDQHIIMMSKSLESLTGYSLKEVPNIERWVHLVYRDNATKLHDHIKTLYTIDESMREGIVKLMNKDDNPVYLDWHTTLIGYNESGLKIMISTGIDKTEQKTREQEMKHISYIDELSGLYNRRYYQALTKTFDQAEDIGVILADINGLKLVNDIFGHEKGDEIIILFGDILKRHFPKDSHIIRLGGDEYVIISETFNPHETNQLKIKIKQAFKNEAKDFFSSVAVGFTAKRKKESLLEALSRAENMLYRDKVYQYHKNSDLIIEKIKTLVYETTDESKDHIKRLHDAAEPLKKALNLSQDKCKELTKLIELHDIGKLSMDRYIFKKKEGLSREEKKHMERHSEVGYRIASSIPKYKHIAYPILTHHENIDGSGYPLGLENDDIPLTARIFRVLDTYVTMTANTQYRPALSKAQAVEFIRHNKGALFDARVVDSFLDIQTSA